METPIDFVSVFPDDFGGSPNVTVTPDGRRFSPKTRNGWRSEDRLDLFDEAQYTPDFAASAFREIPSPDLSRKPQPVMENIFLIS